MISRTAAITRGILVTAASWGAGAGVTTLAFRILGASTTVNDGSGNTRVQIIWWGSHAFCACGGALLGAALGGTALTNASLSEPLPASLSVAIPILVMGMVVVGVLTLADVMGPGLALANLLGLLIGAVCGSAYVIARGMPDDLGHSFGTPRQRSQGWGSR